MSPVVVLTGPPGAGKTTVGRALAGRLGVDLLDTDAAIVDREGMEVSDIFVERGEEHFRAVERAVVADALASHAGVLALGGGAIMADETRAALAGHRVVLLEVGVRDAVHRAGLDQPRPLLGLNPRAALIKLMEARRPLYEEVATLRVDTSGKEPDAIAAEIVAAAGLGEGS